MRLFYLFQACRIDHLLLINFLTLFFISISYLTQKFFKAKNSTRGSGIGLAVANEIIENHGGMLDIASTEHVGTTVSINLPIHKPQL